MSESKLIRRHIAFNGWVQGVGFRYRARHAAQMFGCTGWCRNEWDGTVTMEVQGTQERIARMLQFLEEGRFIRIDNTEEKAIPLDVSEREFLTE